jgi:hypothetical protein
MRERKVWTPGVHRGRSIGALIDVIEPLDQQQHVERLDRAFMQFEERPSRRSPAADRRQTGRNS